MTKKEFDKPIDVYEGNVRPEWIDGSGHMYAAYYVVAFGEANDAALELLTLGETYRQETRSAPFLVEMHTTYLREMLAETKFRVTFQLLQFDRRRMRYFLRMFHAVEGHLVATVETAIVHVDLKTRKSSDLPESAIARLSEIYDGHKHLEFPPQAGRGITLA
ncbi:MAG: thioesterase family protein [Hyphomicrobiaceae bacterium]